MLILFLLIIIAAVVGTYVLTIVLPFQRQLVINAISKLRKEASTVDEQHRILARLDNDVSKFLRPMIKEWLSLEEYR